MFVVHLRDGRTLKEADGVNWKELSHQDITSLQLFHNKGGTHTISIDGKNVKLLQLKRNILDMLAGTDMICERVVGFILEDKVAVKLTVDEKTGNTVMTVEVKDEKGKWRRL
jgi:hypothetical protein